MTRIVGIFLLAALAFPLMGCESSAKKKARLEKQQAEAEQSQRYETGALALMAGDAKAIKHYTDEVNAQLGEKTPDPPRLRIYNKAIGEAAGQILGNTVLLDKDMAQQRKAYWSLKTQLKDCQDDKDKTLLWFTMWGIIVGALIVVGSMAASILARSMTGLPWMSAIGNLSIVGLALGGVSLGVRLLIQSIGPYRWIVGIAAACALACSRVVAVWTGWKRGRLKQGFAEVVATGEAVKARPDVPNEAIAQEAAKIQSPATTEMVQKFKASNLVAEAAVVAATKKADDATVT